MADSAMLARRQIRLAVIASLAGDAFSNVTIDSPGDWSTPPEDLPAMLVRSTGDNKQSIAKSQPDFTTNVSVEIEARVGMESAELAQDAIEQLCFDVEQAILTNYALISVVNQVASVDTKTEITSDGKVHFGAAMMVFTFEVPEMFEPTSGLVPLQEIQIHNDMIGTFDSSGTYSNPPFPSSVLPAPRTSGPDGRDEGALDIHPPQ